MSDELLTHKELAERLRVRPSTVKAWAKDRLIPAIRIGTKVIRFDYDEVLKALRANQAQGGPHD